MNALISTFFPLHEGPAQASLMLLDQPHLDSIHIVVPVLAVFFPDHQGLVLDITVLKVGLSKRVILRLGSSLFGKAFFLVLKLLALGYLRLEHGSCLLKLILRVAESDRIEARLEKALRAHTLHVPNQRFLPGKELVLAGLFAPVLPGEEFAIGHLLPLLLACVLQCQENPLLKRRLCHYLAKHIMFGLHVLRSDCSDPLDEGLSLRS